MLPYTDDYQSSLITPAGSSTFPVLPSFLYCDLYGTTIDSRRSYTGSCISSTSGQGDISLSVRNARCLNGDSYWGGAIWLSDVPSKFENCSFENCNALIAGGAIYVSNSSLDLHCCNFSDSYTTPIKLSDSIGYITSSLFQNNQPRTLETSNSLVFVENSSFCQTDNPFAESGVIDISGNSIFNDCYLADCNLNGVTPFVTRMVTEFPMNVM